LSTATSSWITRAETAADVAAIREVNQQAFGGTFEPSVIDALRTDPNVWLPGLSLVATTADDQVVGYALLSRCHVDEVPVLSLGPVAVAPAYQGRGAGSAAIRAALAAARDLDEGFVVVLGHATYYPRFGFTPASSFGIRATYEVSDENLMALSLNPAAQPPSGTIHYPPAWGI
jgi:putative acetyltransferase